MSYPITAHGFRHGPMEQTLSSIYRVTQYRIAELDLTNMGIAIQYYWVSSSIQTQVRDARMINWFFHGGLSPDTIYDMTTRRSYDPIRKRLFRYLHQNEIHEPTEMELKYNVGEAVQLPTLVLSDFPEFFRVIGFDYKLKKWF